MLAVAEIVYVMLGFGAGLIAVGTLAVFFPNMRDVVVMLLVVNLPAEAYIVFKERKTIRWRGLLLLMVGIAVGIPTGTWLLKTTDLHFLLSVLGLLLVVFGILFFAAGFRNWNIEHMKRSKWGEPFIGAIAGALAGMFGTGGPPLIAYFQIIGAKKALFRANLMACFFFFTIVRAPSYVVSGLITQERLVSSLLVLPAVLLGAVIGNSIHVRISEKRFKQVVSLTITAIGVVLLV
ncbi:MAG: sulfite exporter TauE/SafE family protein [Deltaproteobacteria bacterium]|nr:sulfite exporter TauE/SafE family protein [Deltaproteobacteria bacterium]